MGVGPSEAESTQEGTGCGTGPWGELCKLVSVVRDWFYSQMDSHLEFISQALGCL